MRLRDTQHNDLEAILALYKKVALVPGGLAHQEKELDEEYTKKILSNSLETGLSMVIVDRSDKVVAEVHAYPPGLFCFSHVLTELTIAVDSEYQGTGLGRRIFEAFMLRIIDHHPEVNRVELITRESNSRAINFYQTLGFSIEGKMHSRIKNTDGVLEADIPMAWIRFK